MRQALESGIAVARGAWRYRWQGIGAAWGIVLVGWAAVHVLTVPEYPAKAQVYIDTQTVLRPLLEGLTVEINPTEQVGLMARQLLSQANLEHVARQTGLDRQEATKQPLGVVLESLKANISVQAERASSDARNTNFYVVSYANRDPALAKQVVQSLIDAFAENTLAEIRQDAERARSFMDQQIADYQERVAASEKLLRQFQREHVEALPERGRGYFERLQSEQAALQDVELQIRQTEAHRDELQAQLNRTPAATRAISADGSPILSPRESRLTQLRSQLDQLVLKYTEAHPDVIETRAKIAALERERRTRGDPSPTTANPMYQQLETNIKEGDALLAALRIKREALQDRLKSLQAQIDTLPAVEDELRRLTEDYKSKKKNYEELLTRRKSMEMSETVEQKSRDLRFRVIDPPNVPVDSTLQSAWKRKLAMTTAVLLAGFLGGVALAYVLSQLRMPVYSQHVLSELTGLPVYGVITDISTASVRLRRRMELVAFAATGLLILAAYGGVLAVQFRSTHESVPPLVATVLAPFGGTK